VDVSSSGVKQDVDLTGNPYNVGWVGSSDGMLVVDAAADGNIDAPTEATFQNWVPYAKTSLQGLAAFDTDGDGAIDAGDKVFDHLRIWTDSNGDGASQDGELKSLSDLGIQSISLKADTTNVDDKQLKENEILTTSTVTLTDGTTRTLYDIALGVDKGGQDTSSSASPTPAATGTTPAADPSSVLAQTTDAATVAATTTTPSDTLQTPLDTASAGVAATSAGSTGPSGDVVVADATNASTTEGWWDNTSGQSLSDAINTFNNQNNQDNSTGTPTTSAIDAAMIQRHLLLRQAIAGFTIQGSAPAIFARQGTLDTQATLAAATTASTVANVAA
jgi:hypothetical protein